MGYGTPQEGWSNRRRGGPSLRKSIPVSVGEYDLHVDDFDDWLEALNEIELGRIRIEIARTTGLGLHSGIARRGAIPCISLTAKERLICALLLQHPKGVSKESLQAATGMKPTSLATYLSSKQEGLAEGIRNTDNGYVIEESWLDWALKIASEAMKKCTESETS